MEHHGGGASQDTGGGKSPRTGHDQGTLWDFGSCTLCDRPPGKEVRAIARLTDAHTNLSVEVCETHLIALSKLKGFGIDETRGKRSPENTEGSGDRLFEV